MNKEQFQQLIDEIMETMGDVPGSHMDLLSRMANQRGVPASFVSSIKSLEGSLGAVRIILQYLMFDLEATRRERDNFRMALEDQQ